MIRGELEDLQHQLAEAKETIRALVSGEIDSAAQAGALTPILLRASQQNLMTSERLLRAVFDESRDAKLITDDQGRYVEANPAACRLFGTPKEFLLGKTIAEFAAPEYPMKTNWANFLSSGHLSGEFLLIRPDGERRVLELWARANVLPGRHLSVMRDVTDQRAATRTLVDVQQQLRTVISNAPLILFAIDKQGRYTLHEGKGVELVGLRPGELVGILAVDRQHHHAGAVTSIERALGGEEVQCELEQAGIVFDCTLIPLRDDAGTVIGVTGIAIDVTPRRRAEEALRQSEARFRALIEHSAEGILLIGADGIITYASPSAGRILGVDHGKLVGTAAIHLAVDEDRSFVHGPSSVSEFRVWRGDGEVRWVERLATDLRDQPAVAALVANFRDITDRRIAEEALRETQRLLEEAQAGARLGSWSSGADPDAPITWSRECARIFGRDTEQPPTLAAFVQMAHPDDQPRLIAASQAAMSHGTSLETEHRIVRPSGEVRWVYARSVIERHLVDGKDLPYRVVGVIQDISDRRRGDADRALLASIVESSGDAIISRGLDGTIRTWNRGAEKLTSYTAAEAIGQPISMVYPPEQRLALDEERLLVDRGQSLDQFEMVVVRKDGTRVDVALSSSLLSDEHGQVTGASIIARDISERKKTDAALRLAEEQLRQAQKMEAVGSLAGGVAHDFNNLLTVILSYTEMIVDDLQPADPMRVDLEEVLGAGRRAMGLTRQLLAFSRKQMLEPVFLDLNDVIRGVQKMLGRLLGEDVELSFQLSPRPARLHADIGQIEQVIMNLVVNARDAMPTGGRLTIETSNVALDTEDRTRSSVKPGDYVLLEITDTGTGMDRNTLDRIFDPFFTTKDKSKGTGLGLSTAYGIVQQTGGQITVTSELGIGTSFKVYLPRTERRATSEVIPVLSATQLGGAETILLVEDDIAVRGLMMAVLRRAGYHVLEAENAGDAFLQCEQFTAGIDLLITDVVMPRLGGRQLAERLVAQRPGMKVLFISGYTEDTIVRHGIIEAEIEFLAKPLTPDALLRKVRSVIDGRARRPSSTPSA